MLQTAKKAESTCGLLGPGRGRATLESLSQPKGNHGIVPGLGRGDPGGTRPATQETGGGLAWQVSTSHNFDDNCRGRLVMVEVPTSGRTTQATTVMPGGDQTRSLLVAE